MKRLKSAVRSLTFFASLAAMASPSHATLYDRGGGLIYDSALDVTWLQDANYADKTYVSMFGNVGYAGNGILNRPQVLKWVSALSYFDAVRGVTLTGWTLPSVQALHPPPFSGPEVGYNGTDIGYNVNTGDSQLADLAYLSLGNLSYYDKNGHGPQPGWSLNQSSGPFINLSRQTPYFATGSPPNFTFGWYFNFGTGGQSYLGQYPTDGLYKVLVMRPGDVAAVVPEPRTYAMLLIGLAMLAVARRQSR